MAQITAAERLAKVKIALGITGNYQDDTISLYIDEVIDEMITAGVNQAVANSAAAVGAVAVGVNDLWNYSSGDIKHSEYFNRRLIQLSTQSESGGGGGTGGSYNNLTDLPTLNGSTIKGDLESDDVGIEKVDSSDIIDLF